MAITGGVLPWRLTDESEMNATLRRGDASNTFTIWSLEAEEAAANLIAALRHALSAASYYRTGSTIRVSLGRDLPLYSDAFAKKPLQTGKQGYLYKTEAVGTFDRRFDLQCFRHKRCVFDGKAMEATLSSPAPISRRFHRVSAMRVDGPNW